MKIILLNILLLFSAKMGQGFAKSFEIQKVTNDINLHFNAAKNWNSFEILYL